MLLNCSAGRRLLKVSWTARRSNQSILKEISPKYSLEDWYSSWSSNILATLCEELYHWKRPWCWERLKAGGEENDREWDGWHHWLDGHEFEQVPGVGDRQGSLADCSPWGLKESDMTEWLNRTELNWRLRFLLELHLIFIPHSVVMRIRWDKVQNTIPYLSLSTVVALWPSVLMLGALGV